VDGLNRKTHGFTELRYLEAGVGGISSAIVEKVADIVSPKNVYQPFVFRPVFLYRFHFVSTGSESARGGVFESRNSSSALP